MCVAARMTRRESESRHRMRARTRRLPSRAVARQVAMNREEVDHGSQGKGEKVEMEKEGQEGRGEKEEDRREALRSKEKIRSKEKEGRTEESAGEKEICA